MFLKLNVCEEIKAQASLTICSTFIILLFRLKGKTKTSTAVIQVLAQQLRIQSCEAGPNFWVLLTQSRHKCLWPVRRCSETFTVDSVPVETCGCELEVAAAATQR